MPHPLVITVFTCLWFGSVNSFIAVSRCASPSFKHIKHHCRKQASGIYENRKNYAILKSSKHGQESDLDRLQQEVLDSMRNIVDPDLGKDIVTLGFIKQLTISPDSGVVSFDVELTTPACPVKENFRIQCQEAVEALNWVDSAHVTMTAQPKLQNKEIATGLSLVQNIIAVSSCKGGVGKSTTAVNLAFMLQQLGAKVGILDADIYGPSLPTMVKPEKDFVEFVGNEIKPLECDGVKLMSYGYVNEGAAIMRGPMVVQLVQQFVSLTSWGELDYLIIDMPPGTGDIQLTLCQNLNITAAVIVTTPQRLSFTDVVKGIDMFDAVNIPSIAVVENMAYYEEIGTDILVENAKNIALKMNRNLTPQDVEDITRAAAMDSTIQNKVFGKGHSKKLAEMWGITNVFSMPLHSEIAHVGDTGVPLVLKYPNSKHAERFRELAVSVVREVSKLRFGNAAHPTISYDEINHVIKVSNINSEFGEIDIDSATLRRSCKCASCVEEFSGRPLLDPESVPDTIKPLEFAPIGNYATSVDWSDGHKSLYPYVAFVSGYYGRERKLEKLRDLSLSI